ncbi:YopX family protein [Thomasclavelia cocleata]|nr:YopX family protein [Thomasclavelia cocleata]MCR1959863.1 YopX family protein [Thomasclavelia cocleata]
MEQKFRAFYQGDIEDYYDLTFYSQVIEGEMWFVCNKDSDIKFEASYVFGGEDWVINMCTGLTDLNDELIYEGDILPFELSNKTFEYYYIKYDDENCQFKAVNKCDTNIIHHDMWGNSSVAGNIHCNKILLDNLDLPQIGSLAMIKTSGESIYLSNKWYRNNENLQNDIDKAYYSLKNIVEKLNKEIFTLKSRNIFQRIFRKYE